MSSGVLVNSECQSMFQQLSEGKNKLRYIIYKIEDKEVVVEVAVSPEEVSHKNLLYYILNVREFGFFHLLLYSITMFLAILYVILLNIRVL